MEAVAAHTGPLTALLDVGAGVGTGTFALAARFADALVTAVDSSAYGSSSESETTESAGGGSGTLYRCGES